jgi:polysaccharide biosynthesis protein PslG
LFPASVGSGGQGCAHRHNPTRGVSIALEALVRLLTAVIVLILVALASRPAVTQAAVPGEFFGVSAVNPQPDDFERMGEADVGTYRMSLGWPTVQSAKDDPYDWTVPDFGVSRAVSNGMQPLPVAAGSPGFAGATRQTPPLGSTSARVGWQRFLTAAVERYGPDGEFWRLNPGVPYRPVRAWQIWNEPNTEWFWRPKPSPRKYAELLELSATAIRRADPSAQIVLGGMFGFPTGDKSIAMPRFLKRLYRPRSARKSFDAVALHPYGGTLPDMKYQISRARRIMDSNRDRRTPIWITEIGWATDGPRKWPLVTSRKGQAKLLKKSFKLLLARRQRFGIRRVIWFVWRDYLENPSCGWCGSAGLLDRNGKPKPSWSQFTHFTARAR